MSKKLISLLLVLAFASVSSAASIYWNTNVFHGDWSATTSWYGGVVPTSADFAGAAPYDGYPNTPASNLSIIIDVTTTDAIADKISATFRTTILNIQPGAVLTNAGTSSLASFQIYHDTAFTIDLRGTIDIPNNSNFKMGGGTAGPMNILNIENGGLLSDRGSAHTSQFAVATTGAAGTGTNTVNIKNGGILAADTYSIGTTATGKIYFYAGGAMYVYSGFNSNDIGNKMLSGDGGTVVYETGVSSPFIGGTGDPWYGVTTLTKIYEVPEPVTIALLGLGGLLLRRKH